MNHAEKFGSALQLLRPSLFAAERLRFRPDPPQVRVLDSNVSRGILNCSRQWGKSTVTAVLAVHRAFFRNASLTLVLSPTERQSAEFLTKATGFLRALDIDPRGDGHNSVSLLFPNGSRIVGLPGKESNIRGFSSVSLLLIDEAARVNDELYYAVRPMLAASAGSLWLISTPFGKRGFFYQSWASGGPEWTRFQVPATECPRILPEFLQEERRVLGEHRFRREYLCEFLEADGALFNEELLRSLVRDDVPPLLTD